MSNSTTPTKSLKSYRVCMSAHAVVVGSLVVEAESKEEAEKIALASEGDVSWRYDGLVEGSVEVDSCDCDE